MVLPMELNACLFETVHRFLNDQRVGMEIIDRAWLVIGPAIHPRPELVRRMLRDRAQAFRVLGRHTLPVGPFQELVDRHRAFHRRFAFPFSSAVTTFDSLNLPKSSSKPLRIFWS